MALPNLTDEQRAQALQRAQEVRTERATLKKQLKACEVDLPALFEKVDAGNDAAAKLKVSAALASLPKIGKAKSEKIMAELGIAPTRRMRGLGKSQRAALLTYFGYTS